jgi:hypothetical protein
MMSEIQGIPIPKVSRTVKERVIDKVAVEQNQEFDGLCAFDHVS